MRRNRILYVTLFVLNIILLLMTSETYMIGIIAVMAVIPIVINIAGNFERYRLRVDIDIDRTAKCNDTKELVIHMDTKGRMIISGQVYITLKAVNHMFGYEKEDTYVLYAGKKDNTLKFDVNFKRCGSIDFSIENVYVYDIFGLYGKKIEQGTKANIRVYPGITPVIVEQAGDCPGYIEDSSIFDNKKGSDVSEVYGLRDYYPGDDVRLVHWKLSGRMQKMIIREPSEPSYYQNLVMVDIGLHSGHESISDRLIMAAIELGNSISRQMVSIGMNHSMGIIGRAGIECYNISNSDDRIKMMEDWMSIPIPENCGNGYKYFITDNKMSAYTKMVYITLESFPDEFLSITDHVDITVISVTGGESGINVLEKDDYRIIEIPVRAVYGEKYTIKL